MTSRRRPRRRAPLALAGILATACTAARGPEEAVVVVESSEAGRRGAALAADDLRALGLPLRLVPLETRGDDSATGTLALTRIVDETGALAVVGLSTPETTLSAAHILNQRQVPLLVPDGTSVLLGGIGPWVFRLCPSDRGQGEILANHAIRSGYRRVGILYALDDYGKGLAAGFSQSFTRQGGEISLAAGHAAFADAPGEDVAPALAAIHRTRPDALLLATPLPDLARQRAAQMLLAPDGPPRLGGGGTDEPVAARTDRIFLEGMQVTLLAAPKNARAQRFAERYRKRFATEPETAAFFCYDAVTLVGLAGRDSERTREAVRRHLVRLGHELPPHEGLSGSIRFDESGQATDVRFVLAHVHQGAYEGLEP